ncbi:OST-HTH/LOTUS domain-containing protein [Marinobacter sp. TBZ242]|uniref:OST-HTH/LOTUS domain-containing protein n=1 Tax=Marinobacter azerbaijanicus TaxID=3050455 RepID=A0ABT7II41_9GAMM|nr:OST-HTH/LOTUS domain-containing protein [Marinobacter sp. TBZ242]MDL0433825.1 OST-HTH/LOTUS domain-containing protein [Marinobacter sp. TBZ242]
MSNHDGREKYKSQSIKIFVVDSCRFSQEHLSTNIKGRVGDGEIYSISAKGDARRLAGGLCFVDMSKKEIWSIDKPDLRMPYQGGMGRVDSGVYEEKRKKELVGNSAVTRGGESENNSSGLYQYPCKLCKSIFSLHKDYKKHLRKVHDVSDVVVLSFASKITGLMIVGAERVGVKEGGLKNKGKGSVDFLPDGEIGGVAQVGGRKGDLNSHDFLRSLIISGIKASLDASGWARLSNVGDWFRKEEPNFSPKMHGFKNLSGLITSFDYIEIKKVAMRKNPMAFEVWVKVKN